MLIRPQILVKGRDVLSAWQDASEFTKMFILLESTAVDGEGYSLHELALILQPTDTNTDGSPTLHSLGHTGGLKYRVRHSPLNDSLVPYATLKTITDENGKTSRHWITSNIRNKAEWKPVTDRMYRMIDGYKRNIARFSMIVNTGLATRQKRTEKYKTKIMEARLRGEQVAPKIKRKKKTEVSGV